MLLCSISISARSEKNSAKNAWNSWCCESCERNVFPQLLSRRPHIPPREREKLHAMTLMFPYLMMGFTAANRRPITDCCLRCATFPLALTPLSGRACASVSFQSTQMKSNLRKKKNRAENRQSPSPLHNFHNHRRRTIWFFFCAQARFSSILCSNSSILLLILFFPTSSTLCCCVV